MIKFRCKHCSNKIGVKDEHAGRKVRCPQCKEPIRIPKPKPKPKPEDDFVLEMVAPGDGGLGDSGFELEVVEGPDADLAALAEMEAGAQASMATGQPTGAKCPACGKKSKQGAAICMSCGYNFKTKGKLKTDVQAAAPSYGGYRPSQSPTEELGWLDRNLSNTNTIFILLFGCCCWPSLIVGIVGLIICKDPQARSNALMLVIIQVVLNVLYVIQVVLNGGLPVAP